MTIRYDGHGAPVTETVHEIVEADQQPSDGIGPAEAWAVCSCGWEFASQESIGGGVEPYGPAFEEHLAESDDSGPDCGEVDG